MKYIVYYIFCIFCVHYLSSVPLWRVPKSSDTLTSAVTSKDSDINSKSRKSEILDNIIEESDYDSEVRPVGFNGSGPTKVFVKIKVERVENIDDIQMQYSVQITFWQEWVDPRLIYSHLQSNIDYLQLMIPERIWLPDLFFVNEKSGHLHDLMVPNRYTRMYPNGGIRQNYRLSLMLSCNMDLHAYPLDIQVCPLQIGSSGWTDKDLVLNWKNNDAVIFSKDYQSPTFRVLETYSTVCSHTGQNHNYSCLLLHMKFKRNFGFYLIQIYIPCSMLVLVSWVSFFLEPHCVEARISLGVTTILTIVTQTYGINQNSPPASYAKALDVWTACCQAMVFGALLEFAAVNYLCSLRVSKAQKQQWVESTLDIGEIEKEEERLREEAIAQAKRVDVISQIAFPSVFIIFNGVYWCIYLLYQ